MTIVGATRGTRTIEIGGRRATVQGESYPIESSDPTFEAYSKLLHTWDDGTPLTDAERVAILDDLVACMRERGGTVSIL